EHAILHLLYSRFITKFLHDIGVIGFDEPFKNLFTQGMIIKDGAKMSKSKGNVVSPDELIAKYGADTVRLYTLFIGPPEKDAEWSDRGVEGSYRFLGRVWRLAEKFKNSRTTENRKPKTENRESELSLKRKIHQTIRKVTEDLDGGFHFNTAISAIMELVNETYDFIAKSADEGGADTIREAIESVVILLSPFVPHISEEMWRMLGKGNCIFKSSWPKYDKDAIALKIITIPIQINGKLRSKVEVPFDVKDEELRKAALSDEKILKWIRDKTVKDLVIVPKKLVNIVV
ncbi:MAG: class I tRNA ligase family protein, partial [Candidatus Omnitrophica bacterium]|nr:class I tRNA ligase family protein [Candidatus Omnitrophota bacterium]